MARRHRTPAPDQAQRDAAIAERDRNVIVDAGVGTGKTTILVDRLVDMVAPESGGRAVPISRIAAITFTRKAAGELRLRIRERLLEELSVPRQASGREAQLRDAIAGLDTAYVGTIHSFADRLLRLKPVEARLSPSYDIVEENAALVQETFDVLLQAVESGTLAAELEGTEAAGRADEVTAAILDAIDSGLHAESRQGQWQARHGLDALVKGFINWRDVRPPDSSAAVLDTASFQAAVDEFLELARPVAGSSIGADWIMRTADVLRRLRGYSDPLRTLRELWQQLDHGAPPKSATKCDTFADDHTSWRVWKVYIGKAKDRPTALRDDLCAPLNRWMATRLVRLFPIVLALYEEVKSRHRKLDELDLLVKLRDLLVANKAARGEYQKMFDHIFVDEFQDTDPLQAEIVLYLCEREPRADRWEDVMLSDGKLTLVGDPEQSIYRFRRADIAMYDRVRQVVARQVHREAKLSANFRSVPPLIEWLNDRFTRILGTSQAGRPFDEATGTVFHQPLAAGRKGASDPAVCVLPFALTDGGRHRAADYRELEGRVLARYLRWLVESSNVRVTDPLDDKRRKVRYGDMAILAASTSCLSFLLPRLDLEGIPYASRGGTLFLGDALHRQFLLGLRALADREDGIAEAALLRPPFFAVDPAGILREKSTGAATENSRDEQARRVRDARELVRELRRCRFDRSPGATARDLLERTAFARVVALGPNGLQRLSRLRELCLVLEQTAAREGLDYDSTTARLREWVKNPAQLDPPHPVGAEAVQVITVHQSKGLEFPVVAIWDSQAGWGSRQEGDPWRMERDGRGWLVNIAGLTWEEPSGTGIRETERAYLAAERRRLVYVAATRARDLLIIPRAGNPSPGKSICGDLLDAAPERLTWIPETYVDGREPDWAREVAAPVRPVPLPDGELEGRVRESWEKASRESAQPRFQPASVSGEADVVRAAGPDDLSEAAREKPREGRFGDVFGNVVHHAIGLVLQNGAVTADDAVRRSARRYGLAEHLDEAIEDVTRAMDTLRSAGLARPPGADLRLEYPVAGPWEEGQLLSGYIDLVSVKDDRTDIIDFKTDAPPDGPVEQAYPRYAAQVRTYRHLLAETDVLGDRHLRCGLLFTADGGIRWIEEL